MLILDPSAALLTTCFFRIMEKKTSNQIIKEFTVIQLTPMHHHRGYSQPTIPEFLTIFPF